jgi:hypothetical protein
VHDADDAVETELKLRLWSDARATLEHHPAFGPPDASTPHTRHEVTTYFDTPDRMLSSRGHVACAYALEMAGQVMFRAIRYSCSRGARPAVPFWRISGSRASVWFLVEFGAAIVPSFTCNPRDAR